MKQAANDRELTTMSESVNERVVLVVDDIPTNLSALFKKLNQAGFKVLMADSGTFALSQAAIIQPDIILLDVMMPDLDGFTVCRRLKDDAATRDIPIIFMTALNDIESRLRGFAVGGVDYVTKPLRYPEVLARLNTHLTNRILQKTLQEKVEQLETVLAQVKTLQGLLPICAHCKKIRDDKGYWQQLESYLEEHSDVEFSHGLCPDCLKEHYPEYYREID